MVWIAWQNAHYTLLETIPITILFAAFRIAPVMGAGYHTLHHTVYNKNYGHYFTYMDKLHNTLFTPEEDEERRQQRQK